MHSSIGFLASKQGANFSHAGRFFRRRGLADVAAINSIAALGDTEGKLDELRRRYPNLDITSWTRENRVQM